MNFSDLGSKWGVFVVAILLGVFVIAMLLLVPDVRGATFTMSYLPENILNASSKARLLDCKSNHTRQSGALLRLSPFVLVADTTDQLGLFFFLPKMTIGFVTSRSSLNFVYNNYSSNVLMTKGRHYNDTEIFVHHMNGLSKCRAL